MWCHTVAFYKPDIRYWRWYIAKLSDIWPFMIRLSQRKPWHYGFSLPVHPILVNVTSKNVFKFGTKVHLESRMNWSDFGGQQSRSMWLDSSEQNISRMSRENFFRFGTSVHVQSGMKWLDFDGRLQVQVKAQGQRCQMGARGAPTPLAWAQVRSSRLVSSFSQCPHPCSIRSYIGLKVPTAHFCSYWQQRHHGQS